MFVDVALPVPLRKEFAYRAGDALGAKVQVGQRVVAPFRGRLLPGVVTRLDVTPPEHLKSIADLRALVEDEPLFSDELLAFLRKAARYYFHPLGEVLGSAAPAIPTATLRKLREAKTLGAAESLRGVKATTREVRLVRAHPGPPESQPKGPKQRAILAWLSARAEVTVDALRNEFPSPHAALKALEEKGYIILRTEERLADPFFRAPVPAQKTIVLNDAQQRACEVLRMSVASSHGDTYLLHGVTGAGKTEVYLEAVAETLSLGMGALVLLPEIALTPQLAGRFRARFGDSIAVLHSGLSARDRFAAWRRLRSGQTKLAIGVRSGLFAPVQDLGLIVVDEEHDSSFKQEDGFRYNARDMAVLRASLARATCVLGSATPSLESYARAARTTTKHGPSLLELRTRATSHSALPSVEVVDLRRHRGTPSGHLLLTATLEQALRDTFEMGMQSILFLNRRGFASTLQCGACGEAVMCPSCSITLTEHRAASMLRCHYCGYGQPRPIACPSCGSSDLLGRGLGTEQLERAVSERMPQLRVARLDRDATLGKSHEEILEAFRQGEVDILVGTQMVTKGHDIANVGLVGVMLAEQSLTFPDFRAGERTFQLLTQVAGRTGRGERAGRVVLQTFQPEHPAIRFACKHDYHGFREQELQVRAEVLYPPNAFLVAVRSDSPDEVQAKASLAFLSNRLRALPELRDGSVLLLGPAPAPIAKIRNRYRYHLLLKARTRAPLRKAAAFAVHLFDDLRKGPVRLHIDVDPVSTM